MVKACVPKYDEDMLETCDGSHVDEGKPCRKCTDELWPKKRGPNPCCKNSKPPKREDYPNLSDDQFGRLSDLWYEFRDQYCPVYIDPPKDPPKKEPVKKVEEKLIILPPGHVDEDADVSTRVTMPPAKDVKVREVLLYPDNVPEPYGTGNWRM